MTPAIPDASARQYTGGPSPVPGRGGNRNPQVRRPELSNVEVEIASLLDRSTQELRLAWRKLHRTEPPKPDTRLIKLLIRARRFNATLVGSDSVPFSALAKREGVSPSYFTRLVRLSYLAPDITQAILDGRQPRDLTSDKLLAHSRLPLAWHEQRSALGFA